MRIPLLLVCLATSSVAQINYTAPTRSFYEDFGNSSWDLSAQQLWQHGIVDKAYGESRYEYLKKDIPWMALSTAISDEDAKYAKKMVVEALAVACSFPKDHVNLNWDKFTQENGIKGDLKRASVAGSKKHIAWGLLDQSLDRKDFTYAEKLSQFLNNNYSLENLFSIQRKDDPPSTYFEQDISNVWESGDFKEVQRLWKRAIWEATEKCNPNGWYEGELPWTILGMSIKHEERAFAKMMLIETYDKANLPPNHYAHAKKFWTKLSQKDKNEKDTELIKLRGLERYVVWGLLVESLNHKDFTYAQELSKWLQAHYSKRVLLDQSPILATKLADEITSLKKSRDFNEAKRLWDKTQTAKVNGDDTFEAPAAAIPWIILDISIANEEVAYAKMMVQEACADLSTLEDYTDAKRLWGKFLDAYSKESYADIPSGAEQYIGWRLLDESLDRKDFEYAPTLYGWLSNNYTFNRSVGHEDIK